MGVRVARRKGEKKEKKNFPFRKILQRVSRKRKPVRAEQDQDAEGGREEEDGGGGGNGNQKGSKNRNLFQTEIRRLRMDVTSSACCSAAIVSGVERAETTPDFLARIKIRQGRSGKKVRCPVP
ncbi:hypothetical protein RUM43_005993 [Polyplax serrata]|uniref:Uncharacterized protein n=1 Tax=Polyplax serrata TaxID=468196 RepID=A0AAN8PEA3_POLSC